jgi:thiol-disulfide isomerase/thioredoxin
VVKRAVCLLTLALGLAACGSDGGPPSAAPAPAAAARALAGSPAPLAALHRQGGRLLGAGRSKFRARMVALRGHPVVVNKWASWCGPCRSEFPFLQRLSVALGRRVAFLGVDAQDNSGDAAAFLRRYPVSYPSYSDPDQEIAKLFDATLAFPTTAFFDATGKLVYIHQGAYASEAKLREDIARYTG